MIYLASPYWHSDPAIRNQRFRAACRATAQMIRQGTTVFSPVVYGHALVGEGLPGDWSFSSKLGVVRSTKRITFQQTRSFYKALSADVPAMEGLNVHAVLVDELHAQKNRELWDTLR